MAEMVEHKALSSNPFIVKEKFLKLKVLLHTVVNTGMVK
jgi:hypothetical protein